MATHEVDSWEGQGLLTLLTVGFVKGQCCCFHLDEFFLVISDLTPRIDHFLLLLLDSDYLFCQLQFEKGLEHPKPQTVFFRQNLQNRRRRQHIHLPNIRQSFFDESLTLVLILNVSEIGQGLDPQFWAFGGKSTSWAKLHTYRRFSGFGTRLHYLVGLVVRDVEVEELLLQIKPITTVFDSLMIVIYLEQEQQVMLIYLMFISIDQFWDFHTQHFRCEDLNAFKFDLRFYLLVGSFAVQHAQDRNLFLWLCH